MKEKRSGKILFISSTAALDGSHIAHVAYGVTKAGALALMKSTAKEFATYNVSSVAILPGTIDTAINQSFTEQQREKMADSNLMKRRGGAEEVAAAVLFLTGPDATFITGASLQVSGGEILAQG